MTAAVKAELPSLWTSPSQHRDRRENASNINVAVITRSASSYHFAGLSKPSAASGEKLLPRALSDNVLIRPQRHVHNARCNENLDGHGRRAEAEDEATVERRHVSGSTSDLNGPGIQAPSELLLRGENEALAMYKTKSPWPQATDAKPRSMSRSLSRLARRSWVSSSRSPSPSLSKHEHKRNRTVPSEASSPFSRSSSSSTLNTQDTLKFPKRLAKGQRQPLSTFMGKVSSASAIPSVPSIPKSFSTDKLPIVRNRTLENPPTVPTSASVERLQGMGTEVSRKKDELWSAFRTLDGDFQKFQSRTSTLKTAVVRSALLPFLRTSADHPSNTALRPEDLDRRVNILNRWWTGLLEMLNGRNGESVSGSDRPTILEAVSSIMVRPEWSLPYQVGRSRSEVGARPLLNSRSTTSLGSTSSNFLAESVFHNVKNIYVQNLLSQMAYVVEKMSARIVPASVVTFCGKATAYAFFYCDSVAEILVRLWAPSQNSISRVLVENQLRKDADLKDSSDSVVSNFPSGLHGLAFKSVRATTRHLRSRPQLPIATAYIPWHGPWVSRWAGRDTDLFFVFTKSYFNLLGSFLPSDAAPEERLCAPGFILLQTQILTILDSVIQGNNTQNCQSLWDPLYAPSLQYDELLGETDASASVLPLPPAATNRSMAEHRLIILLRDCLSGSALVIGKVKEIFAESFERLLKAAARRTSIFNHHACFTLCDFMEEALAILLRHSNTSTRNSSTLDWPFWLRVCRQMTESQNTMTEIRLYTFLYSLWTSVTAERSRKRQVCLEWLLDEGFFEKQFNHWCPMVRAYYMRLLCWRIGRLNDSNSELDNMILKTLTLRLHRVWGSFLYLQDTALDKGSPPISTAPCSPAPSRRLLIIRNDSQPASGGMFLSFDSILSPSSSTVATAYERHGLMSSLMGGDESQESKNLPSMGKKSWSLLKNMMPFALSALDPSRNTPRQGPSMAKGSNAGAQSKINGSLSSKPSNGQDGTSFRAHSFKFSLEWIDGEKAPFGRERQIYPPRLPLSSSNGLKPLALTESDLKPFEQVGAAAVQGKYAGRALAEWDLLIDEFQDFFKRRIAEGVPNDSLVETPTLGIETFRRPG
ncbi:MAG: hypothetical protein Q9225_003526 [Loekoesia sp. 1 TL-2023]